MVYMTTLDALSKWNSYKDIVNGLTETTERSLPIRCNQSPSWFGGCNITLLNGLKPLEGSVHADEVFRKIIQVHETEKAKLLHSKDGSVFSQLNAVTALNKLNHLITGTITHFYGCSCIVRIVTFIREFIQRTFLGFDRHQIVASLQEDISLGSLYTRHRQELAEWEKKEADNKVKTEKSADYNPGARFQSLVDHHYFYEYNQQKDRLAPEKREEFLFRILDKEFKKVPKDKDAFIEFARIINHKTISASVFWRLCTANWPSNLSLNDLDQIPDRSIDGKNSFKRNLEIVFVSKLIKEEKYDKAIKLIYERKLSIYNELIMIFGPQTIGKGSTNNLPKELFKINKQNFWEHLVAIEENPEKWKQANSWLFSGVTWKEMNQLNEALNGNSDQKSAI